MPAFDAELFVEALGQTIVVSKLQDQPDEISERLASSKLIGTHDGNFQCDEIFACAALKLLPEFADAVIVRTRDQALLDQCDIVVDVGAVYDHDRKRYDHHQRGFLDVMDELGCKTKLSASGLVYRHYGREILASMLGADNVTEALYRKMYTCFVEEIDGIDNGVEAFDSGKRNYDVSSTLSSRVGRLNPLWNQPQGDEVRNAKFVKGLQLTAQEFADRVEECANSWWPARTVVIEALENATAVHPSRGILVLRQNCPWSSHLFELEAERSSAGDVSAVGAAKYILYDDARGSWRIQAVPIEDGSFTSRQKLPEAWRGVKGADLDSLTGVEGGTFVHAGGFIGGNKTYEGALAMASKALVH